MSGSRSSAISTLPNCLSNSAQFEGKFLFKVSGNLRLVIAANKAKKVKNAYEPVSDSRIGNWGTMIPPTRAS